MKILLVAFSAWILQQPPTEQHTPLLAYVEQLLAAFGPLPALEDEISTTAQVTSQNPKSRPPSDPPNSSDLPSARELEVLQLLAVGTSNSEIGETLFVSLNTVKRHVRNIFNKLGVNNRTQAVARARELACFKRT